MHTDVEYFQRLFPWVAGTDRSDNVRTGDDDLGGGFETQITLVVETQGAASGVGQTTVERNVDAQNGIVLIAGPHFPVIPVEAGVPAFRVDMPSLPILLGIFPPGLVAGTIC
jgi:hypothetical protein